MSATKDQKKLLARCLENEIPVFVLTGTDALAVASLRAYISEACKMGCQEDFIQDLETNILPDFRDFQLQEPEKVKLPD